MCPRLLSQGGEEPRRGEADREAEHESNSGELKPASIKETNDLAGTGAERHADADFAPALSDGKRDDPIETD